MLLPLRSSSRTSEKLSSQPELSWRTTGTAVASGEEWSGIECARTLYRRRSTVAWITCLGILATMIISMVQPRLYQSQASLEIQQVNENFLNFRDIYPTAASSADASGVYLQTQAEILQQDSLIEEVARKLRLEDRREYGGLSILDNRRRAVSSVASPAAAVRNTVELLKKNINIVPSRTSRIIRIAVEAHDPQLAADIANTLAQTYIEQNIEARQHAAQQTHDALSLQLEQVKNKLLRSEAELDAQGYASGRTAMPSLTHYQTPRREAAANRQFFEALSERVNAAAAASSVRQSNIRLIGPAQPAAHPYKPNLPLNLAIGTVGGLFLGIGWVILREQTNSVLRTPGEAGMYLTVPELGAIPKAVNGSLHTLRHVNSNDGKLRGERAVAEESLSGLSESFRSTLVSLLPAVENGDNPRTFVVTSSQPMEGKTTVVSNLGIALAEIYGKVLLIDGDMRRPQLHGLFDQANSWGLSDVLREKNAIEDLPLDVLVKKTTIPNLYLLPSGARTDNIFSLLCSGRMARLLPRFRQEFDYVLVDTPPCLEFSDARIMARYTEQLLFVVRANYTERRMAQAAVQGLLRDGTPVMGVILNRWDTAHSNPYAYACYQNHNRDGAT